MADFNGSQPPGLKFAASARGLGGFVRQGMDQRKKAATGFASLVGETFGLVTSTPQTLALPAAAAVGDLAVVMSGSNSGTTNSVTGAATVRFANYGSAYGYGVHSKVLTAADLLSGLSLSGAGTGAWSIAVIRGGSVATYRGDAKSLSPASDPACPGYVKSGTHKGTLAAFFSRSTETVASPVGWLDGTAVGSTADVQWIDWAVLLPPSAPIADNTPVVWVGAANGPTALSTYEFT